MPCPARAPAPATGNDYCEVTEPGRARTSRKMGRGWGRTLALVRFALTGAEGRGFTGVGGAFVDRVVWIPNQYRKQVVGVGVSA